MIERVERKIPAFAEEAPIMQASCVELPECKEIKSNTAIEMKEVGEYYIIKGFVDEKLGKENTEIFVRIFDETGEQKIYNPFWIFADVKGKKKTMGLICRKLFLKLDSVQMKIGKHGNIFQD